jgi:hypothetical protein
MNRRKERLLLGAAFMENGIVIGVASHSHKSFFVVADFFNLSNVPIGAL